MKRSVKTLYSQFHQDELFIYRTKPEGDIDHSTNHRNKNVTPSYRESTVISLIKLRLVLDSRLVGMVCSDVLIPMVVVVALLWL